jgi:hypothetical protein
MRMKLLLSAILLTLTAGPATGLGDWKSDLAKKAVGKAARAGIQEAVENALQDAAFDAALAAAQSHAADVVYENVAVGTTARDAIETAMDAADFAASINTAIDIADAAKKANKVRKAIKVFK